MIKIFFAFFVLLVSSVVSFAQTAGTVYGTVTIGDSVLHGAEVHLLQLKRSVQTDDSGNYEFTGVPPGRYTILVHKEGFADASQAVDVKAGAGTRADFRLTLASITEQVTVTASGTEQSVFDSFQTVNSVGSARIAERASTSLGEVLETETGVAKRSFGPGSSRPVIRGFDGDRVLVLQDGVPAGGLGFQSGDHAEPVNTSTLERLEVLKGPATLLYGPNAIGGVVNAITAETNIHQHAHEGLQGFASGFGGSNNNQAGGSLSLDYGFGSWR